MKQLLRDIKHVAERIESRLEIIQKLMEVSTKKHDLLNDVPKMPLCESMPLPKLYEVPTGTDNHEALNTKD